MNSGKLTGADAEASTYSGTSDVERVQRLGSKVRDLRKQRGLTLKSLAKLSGLSHPFLSQVERGVARPSMSSLHQISEALQTNASWLLAGSENTQPARVVRASDTASLPASELGDMDGVRRAVAPESSPFQIVEFVGAPEEFREYWVHDGFETIYVISGVVEVDLDGTLFTLQASDSISYDTRRPHRLRAATAEMVKLLMIEASPTVAH